MSARENASTSIKQLVQELKDVEQTARAICQGPSMRRYSQSIKEHLQGLGDEIARLIAPLQEHGGDASSGPGKRRSPSLDQDEATAGNRSMHLRKRPRISIVPPTTQGRKVSSPTGGRSPLKQARGPTRSNKTWDRSPPKQTSQTTRSSSRSQSPPKQAPPVSDNDLYKDVVSSRGRVQARFRRVEDLVRSPEFSAYLVEQTKSDELNVGELIGVHFNPLPIFSMPEQILLGLSQAVFPVGKITIEFKESIVAHLTDCANNSNFTAGEMIKVCTSHELVLGEPGKKLRKSEEEKAWSTLNDLTKTLIDRESPIHSRNEVDFAQSISLKYEQLAFTSVWSTFATGNSADTQIELAKRLYNDLPDKHRAKLTLDQFAGIVKRIRDGASTMLLAFKTFGWMILFHPALGKNHFQSSRFASAIRQACNGFQAQVDESTHLAAHMDKVKAAHWELLKTILGKFCEDAQPMIRQLKNLKALAGSLESRGV
ncbi:unnamed protein product [Rhizoctonia solani]|uniref:Uncharacterized protein n=1 Tax=Rhizoctonia solani TaxID=456999 RepID=A0A8H2XUA0_9AGAM|nr:unnamed protein product [Rhizoctonia solani]